MKNSFHQVSEVLENYATAVYELDVEKFLAAYHDDIHLYDCWGRWEIHGLLSWRERDRMVCGYPGRQQCRERNF